MSVIKLRRFAGRGLGRSVEPKRGFAGAAVMMCAWRRCRLVRDLYRHDDRHARMHELFRWTGREWRPRDPRAADSDENAAKGAAANATARERV